MTAAEYLFRANVCLTGLFGLYWLLFRRHTFFGLNRAYLLLTLAAAAGLPLLQLPAPTVAAIALPVVTLPNMAVVTTLPDSTGPTLTDWLWGVYLIGVAVGIGRLAVALWRLARLIRAGEPLILPDCTLVLLDDERVAPFSFFRYLVMSRTDFATQPDPILRHEQVHIRQWHSADVLLAELVKIMCWPNPVAWLLARALQQTHEFLADAAATDPAHRADYARFLVGYALGTGSEPLTNSFLNPSQLRLRLRMLLQTPTARHVRHRYWLVLPVLVGLTGLVAARYPTETSWPAQYADNELITLTGQVTDGADKPLPGATVLIMGASHGTTTDAWGWFTLKNVPANARLAVSFVGFNAEVVPLDGQTAVFVRLERASQALGEVVVMDWVSRAEPKPDSTAPGMNPPDFVAANGEVFTVVEQQPTFPGGMNALGRYLARNLQYPDEARQHRVVGYVFVQFVVDETGQIRQPRILKGIGAGCDEEAVRVVSQMPAWKPGQQSGHPVAVQYNLPIMFMLDGPGSVTTSADSTRPTASAATRQTVDEWLSDGFTFQAENVVPSEMLRKPVYAPKSGKRVLYFLNGVQIDDATFQKLGIGDRVQVLKGNFAKPYGKDVDEVVIITTKKPARP